MYMSRNKPAGENNLLALMRNHGSEKNRVTNTVTRKNTKNTKIPKNKKTKSQKNKNKSQKELTRLASKKTEYNRVAREMAKRPQYKGDISKLVLVREPWEPRNDTEYYSREYFKDPKTGRYYDMDHLRLVGRTTSDGKIVPLKLIR